jgi:uncharacterized membrane protein YedE/YeeE
VSSLVAFSSGLVFAVGLALSGMTQPGKVIGFLDFAGAWDPSLACVMGSALAVLFVAQRAARRRAAPLLADSFVAARSDTVDARLVAGAAVFGVGWGLSGFCPGPAVVGVGALLHQALVFMPAMLVGMALFQLLEARRVR